MAWAFAPITRIGRKAERGQGTSAARGPFGRGRLAVPFPPHASCWSLADDRRPASSSMDPALAQNALNAFECAPGPSAGRSQNSPRRPSSRPEIRKGGVASLDDAPHGFLQQTILLPRSVGARKNVRDSNSRVPAQELINVTVGHSPIRSDRRASR
jgi:hypothetical protein